MLSCIYERKPFTTKEEGFSVEDKYKLAHEKKLLCPCCHKPLFYCDEGLKEAHFKHYEVGDCIEGSLRSYDYSSSEQHIKLTDTFITWIKDQHPEAKVIPDHLINRELKTDIYCELGDTKIAIELQLKRISNPVFIKRRELYKSNDIKDIWFFIDETYSEIGSPFHRTYYRTNRRELYFYYYREGNFCVYKGLPTEKWEKVGPYTLIEYAYTNCKLDQVHINNHGRLFIPTVWEKYYEKLVLLREKQREARRFMKKSKEENAHAPRGFTTFDYFWENVGTENQIHGFDNRFDNLFTNKKMISKTDSNAYKTDHIPIIKEESSHQTQQYKEYKFKQENGIEYLDIIILYNGEEHKIRYTIIDCTHSGKEHFLTCRKDSDKGNIMYYIEINPLLESMKKIRIRKYEFTAVNRT